MDGKTWQLVFVVFALYTVTFAMAEISGRSEGPGSSILPEGSGSSERTGSSLEDLEDLEDLEPEPEGSDKIMFNRLNA